MITNLGRQILVTSLNKAIKIAKGTGKLDLKIIHLYSLYIYYIKFTEGKEEFNEINKDLKITLSQLKYKYPDIICDYKLKLTTTDRVGGSTTVMNTPPRVSDVVIDLEGRFTYNFKITDFTKDFEDDENDSYLTIRIYPPPILSNSDARLFYVGIIPTTSDELGGRQAPSGVLATYTPPPLLVPILNITELSYRSIGNLRYIEPTVSDNTTTAGNANKNKVNTNYNFKFKISDDSSYGKLFSEETNINIINSEFMVNLPPTIGDISINADNRAITVMTLTMFTADMAPPYNDPENDLIDAIRINNISNANSGNFYYDNNLLTIGQIITRADLSSGKLTHRGANINTLSGDSLDFSARDEGSMIWVN